MNKKLLVTFCFLLSAFLSYGQSYDWVTGGGSTDPMSPSSGTYEHPTSICTDDNGNVYITSVVGADNITADTFYESRAHNALPDSHILFASYRCDGTMRWAKLIECNDLTLAGNEYGNNGVAYSSGSVYIAGAFAGYTKYIGFDTTFSGNNLSFIARFDTGGQFKWVRLVGPDSVATSLIANEPGTAVVDGQGYIHDFVEIKGSGIALTPSVTSSTNGTYDLKYDSTGNLISAGLLQLDSIWTIGKAVFNKQDDNFYTIIGPSSLYYFTYYSTENSAVCAFRADGSMIWMDTTGGNGAIISLDYKGGNAIYACGLGQFYDTVSTFTLGGIAAKDSIFPSRSISLIYRLDTNGVAKWVYNLQCNEVNQLEDISILPGNKIAVTGEFYDSAIHGTDTLINIIRNPVFLVVDSSGHTVKLDSFIGTGGLDATGNVMTSDAVGNVYVGGTLDYSMSALGLTPYISIGGATNFFLLKYGYDCSCLAAPIAGFTDTGTPNVSFTYTGTTAGIDSIVWSYGDGHSDTGMTSSHTYTNGTYTACATVYTGCGSDEYCKTITIGHEGINAVAFAGVSIYPNPVSGQLTIENAAVGTMVSLFNIVGQQVYYGTIVNSLQALDMQSLTAGTYIIQLTDANGNRINKTVVKE